jgi:hypothetical protein
MKAKISQTPSYSFKMLAHFLSENSSYAPERVTYALAEYKCRFGDDAISDLHGFWLAQSNFRVPPHEIIEKMVLDLALEPGQKPISLGYRKALTDDSEGGYK